VVVGPILIWYFTQRLPEIESQAKTETAAALTSSPTATHTATPTPTATNTATGTATATPTPAVPESLRLEGLVAFDGLYLRTGPGTSFPAPLSLALDAPITALARNEAGDWLYVEFQPLETEGFIRGWVIARSVEMQGSIQDLEITASPATPTPRPIYPVKFRNICSGRLVVEFNALGEQVRIELGNSQTREVSLEFGLYLFATSFPDGSPDQSYDGSFRISEPTELFVDCTRIVKAIP
jgi:hypothetical protein